MTESSDKAGACEDDVRKLLESYPPGIRELANKTRELVRDIAPDATEEMAWSAKMTGFSFIPGTYKGLILTVSPEKHYVNIIFSKGIELLEEGLDETGLLEGTGKRHAISRSEARRSSAIVARAGSSRPPPRARREVSAEHPRRSARRRLGAPGPPRAPRGRSCPPMPRPVDRMSPLYRTVPPNGRPATRQASSTDDSCERSWLATTASTSSLRRRSRAPGRAVRDEADDRVDVMARLAVVAYGRRHGGRRGAIHASCRLGERGALRVGRGARRAAPSVHGERRRNRRGRQFAADPAAAGAHLHPARLRASPLPRCGRRRACRHRRSRPGIAASDRVDAAGGDSRGRSRRLTLTSAGLRTSNGPSGGVFLSDAVEEVQAIVARSREARNAAFETSGYSVTAEIGWWLTQGAFYGLLLIASVALGRRIRRVRWVVLGLIIAAVVLVGSVPARTVAARRSGVIPTPTRSASSRSSRASAAPGSAPEHCCAARGRSPHLWCRSGSSLRSSPSSCWRACPSGLSRCASTRPWRLGRSRAGATVEHCRGRPAPPWLGRWKRRLSRQAPHRQSQARADAARLRPRAQRRQAPSPAH